ncbi:MAG: glutathione S-transferase N-terminal domain-containing protein [Candidatus Thiodiazotropha sp. (ex Myrtea spinifera)]|nr:glutathione S-transferase N-terminal domain-containing protein [Candidatus Thiodiazotropha sp. (ex Myrtea spinifera)]MCU7828075.1 glutathione S-transferase N-terminal domain-containing protein [Candidatus Thiodiazotropha sp. (ex Myrtea sp. 'scaly one' KF741663)]
MTGQVFNWLRGLFRPLHRSSEYQQQVDAETQHLALYHLPLCSYCLYVRRTLWRLSLNIELRNILEGQWGSELRNEGGKIQTPCLQIRHPDRVEWMYESAEITRYLKQRFGANSKT